MELDLDALQQLPDPEAQAHGLQPLENSTGKCDVTCCHTCIETQ
ncbi:ALQxL family class IV lanthipeptide [Kitasatospora azatica]|nr:ALQxL family class IV lanthipeptide [Kitasatospora azatica]